MHWSSFLLPLLEIKDFFRIHVVYLFFSLSLFVFASQTVCLRQNTTLFVPTIRDHPSTDYAILEHKNMPLDDALGLIDRDFERYCLGVREGRIPPRKPPRDSNASVTSLLSKAASGEDLDAGQLQSLINILQEKKQNSVPSRAPPGLGKSL